MIAKRKKMIETQPLKAKTLRKRGGGRRKPRVFDPHEMKPIPFCDKNNAAETVFSKKHVRRSLLISCERGKENREQRGAEPNMENVGNGNLGSYNDLRATSNPWLINDRGLQIAGTPGRTGNSRRFQEPLQGRVYRSDQINTDQIIYRP